MTDELTHRVLEVRGDAGATIDVFSAPIRWDHLSLNVRLGHYCSLQVRTYLTNHDGHANLERWRERANAPARELRQAVISNRRVRELEHELAELRAELEAL